MGASLQEQCMLVWRPVSNPPQRDARQVLQSECHPAWTGCPALQTGAVYEVKTQNFDPYPYPHTHSRPAAWGWNACGSHPQNSSCHNTPPRWPRHHFSSCIHAVLPLPQSPPCSCLCTCYLLIRERNSTIVIGKRSVSGTVVRGRVLYPCTAKHKI